MEKLKKIKAEIFYVRNPMPNYRKVVIEFSVSKNLKKEEIKDKIVGIIHMYNSEITKELIKEIKYKEVK